MFTSVLHQIKTEDDRKRLRQEIYLLLQSLYEVEEGKFQDVLKNSVREKIAATISEEIFKDEVDKGKYLKGLQEEADKLKKVKLTLGFEPTKESIDKFWQFIASALEKNIVLDIEYLPKLVGGAVVIYDGEYRDLSLKSILDMELTKSGNEVLGKVPEKKIEIS